MLVHREHRSGHHPCSGTSECRRATRRARRSHRRRGARCARSATAEGRAERHLARPPAAPAAHRPAHRVLDVGVHPRPRRRHAAPVAPRRSWWRGAWSSAVPTALSGAADWGDTTGPARRVGLVHAAANTTALALLRARRGGRACAAVTARGVALGLAGATAATVGGYLGGHLLQTLGVGVDHTAIRRVHPRSGRGSRPTTRSPSTPRRVLAGEAPVIVLRHHGRGRGARRAVSAPRRADGRGRGARRLHHVPVARQRVPRRRRRGRAGTVDGRPARLRVPRRRRRRRGPRPAERSGAVGAPSARRNSSSVWSRASARVSAAGSPSSRARMCAPTTAWIASASVSGSACGNTPRSATVAQQRHQRRTLLGEPGVLHLGEALRARHLGRRQHHCVAQPAGVVDHREVLVDPRLERGERIGAAARPRPRRSRSRGRSRPGTSRARARPSTGSAGRTRASRVRPHPGRRAPTSPSSRRAGSARTPSARCCFFSARYFSSRAGDTRSGRRRAHGGGLGAHATRIRVQPPFSSRRSP